MLSYYSSLCKRFILTVIEYIQPYNIKKAAREGNTMILVVVDIVINLPPEEPPGEPGWRPGVIRGQIKMAKVAAINPNIE